MYDMVYLPTSMNLPFFFKIDKNQDPVSTTYLTVCLYSHLQLAFNELHLLAIIAKISYQIAWPMTEIWANQSSIFCLFLSNNMITCPAKTLVALFYLRIINTSKWGLTKDDQMTDM
jgi:hypothetical protein